MDSMRQYLGIDPGVTGGYAIIDSEGEPVLYAQFTDWKAAGKVLLEFTGVIALERVHSMPRDGGKSAFTFGSNYGGWLALLEYLEKPFISVPPQTWQKAVLGSFPAGESKPRAFQYVSRRFPKLGIGKSKTGAIDALCIATYCKLKV